MGEYRGKTLEVGKIYEISWIDHFTSQHKPIEEELKSLPMLITTYGRYCGENKDYIILAQNYEPIEHNNMTQHILKVGIKEARLIE